MRIKLSAKAAARLGLTPLAVGMLLAVPCAKAQIKEADMKSVEDRPTAVADGHRDCRRLDRRSRPHRARPGIFPHSNCVRGAYADWRHALRNWNGDFWPVSRHRCRGVWRRPARCHDRRAGDRKSTRLNSSHANTSYAV